MSKRILILLLTVLMVVSMFPSAAFAAEGGIVEEPAAGEVRFCVLKFPRRGAAA